MSFDGCSSKSKFFLLLYLFILFLLLRVWQLSNFIYKKKWKDNRFPVKRQQISGQKTTDFRYATTDFRYATTRIDNKLSMRVLVNHEKKTYLLIITQLLPRIMRLYRNLPSSIYPACDYWHFVLHITTADLAKTLGSRPGLRICPSFFQWKPRAPMPLWRKHCSRSGVDRRNLGKEEKLV